MFLAVPMMWLRNVDHPLMANATVDVCAYMNDAGLATLPRPPKSIAPRIPGEGASTMQVCGVELSPASALDERTSNVWVAVTPERLLTYDRRPGRTDKFVDTWLKESAASGSEVTPLKGPWRRGAIIRERHRTNRISLLADDAGVVLWINAQDIDEPAFVAFSEAIAKALRVKLPAKGKS